MSIFYSSCSGIKQIRAFTIGEYGIFCNLRRRKNSARYLPKIHKVESGEMIDAKKFMIAVFVLLY